MSNLPYLGAAICSILTLAVAASSGCVNEELNPHAMTGGAGGEGGAPGGMGGTGGEPIPDRGDPANWPAECLMTCEQACEALESCGAAEAGYFAIDSESCLQLCELSEGGPLWDDISANFKCCASQGECETVQHCGGWLDHPNAQQSCQKLCGCLFQSAELASLAVGHQAPAPYRFAEHAVMVALPDARTAIPHVRSISLKRSGRYAQARFGEGSGMHTLAQLASLGKLLPTFVDNAGRVSAATGRVYVRAKTSATLATARTFTTLRGGTRPSRVSFSTTLYESTYVDPWDAVDAVSAMRAAGLDAELDMVREYELHYTPNDPLFPEQWHLRNTGQGESTSGVDPRVSEAWDVTRGDPQVLIAVNDDGVDLDHPDFEGRLELPLNYPSDWQALMESGQFAGHGTAVTGVAAAGADDLVGGAGACPDCRIIPHLLAQVDITGSFMVSDQEVASGFQRQIDAGAWVINNSWGFGLGDPLHADAEQQSPPIPSVVRDVYDYAENSGRGGLGTVIVFAAGNENTGMDYNGTYATTVAVAAVGDVGLKSYYSCFGPEITIATPSSGALTGITTSAANGSQTPNFGGTSSASPLAAGILGLIFSANPNLTAAEARDILQASATKIDPVWGAYDQDGHSVYYGAGMANAYVAVRMAEGSCTDPASCQAPSDDCGAQCGTGTACSPCRTQAGCATGYVCQALPSLGRMVCVAEKGDDPCPEGTTEHNGHCIPLAETCGVCLGDELCNGRDDNCDGQADEDFACNGGPLCFIDSPPCAEGTVCAARSCVDACDTNDDCEEGAVCRNLKDQYGSVTGARGCVVDTQSGGCQIGCAVLASSLPDEGLDSFNMCMDNGLVDCQTAQACAATLPINF